MTDKVLMWDFDATLGYRVGGMWSSALHDAIVEYDPSSTFTVDDIAYQCNDLTIVPAILIASSMK